MIDFDHARSEFETYLVQAVTGVPTTYENAPDTAAVKTAKQTKASWCRISVKQGEGFATEIGTNPNRRWPGLVMISIFGQLNKGTKGVRDIASTIGQAVVGHAFDDILIRTPELTIMGKEQDWLMANLTIPFELNQLTS